MAVVVAVEKEAATSAGVVVVVVVIFVIFLVVAVEAIAKAEVFLATLVHTHWWVYISEPLFFC